MIRFTKTDAQATLQSKADFGMHCVVTGRHASQAGELGYLCSAHIFPRSTFPDLKNCVENRVPIVYTLHCYHGHDCLDLVEMDGLEVIRPVDIRLLWLAERCERSGYWAKVKARIQAVLEHHESYDPRYTAMVPDLIKLLEDL